MAQYLPETDSEDELPPGWDERATLDGEVYYANHINHSTQWTHPRTGKRKKVSGSLPFGWERKIFPDGKIVYVNHEEKRTSYMDPRLAFAKEVNEVGRSPMSNFRQRFDGSSNALQVLHGQDLSGRVALVTGASLGGIGYEMARSLARCGCSVIFACRSLSKAEAVVGQVRSERSNVKCHPIAVNLASLKSVRELADEVKRSFEKLDILILNAGIFGHPFAVTEDGLEATFQVNYLSHFYLSHLLKPLLMRSTMPKIVSVSAESHRFASLSSSDAFTSESNLVKMNSKTFCSTYAYNDSKLFCLMFALDADRFWSPIKVIAVHPGNMVSSNITRHWWLYKVAFTLVRPFAKSLQQAAASGVFAAASPEMSHVGGIYVNNCFPCEPSKIAMDLSARSNLWMTSLKILSDRGLVL